MVREFIIVMIYQTKEVAMKKKRLLAVSLVAVSFLFLIGCATGTNYQPIVDLHGQDYAQYHRDLAECRGYANQISPANETVGSALLGSVLGAATGLALGSMSGDAGKGAAYGAIIGGVGGGSVGAAKGYGTKEEILRNCLRGRGYNVLN